LSLNEKKERKKKSSKMEDDGYGGEYKGNKGEIVLRE